MKVLVVGSGGREHALAWAAARSAARPEIFSLPGNPGMQELGECLPGDPSDNAAVAAMARQKRIDLVVVGPEMPLVGGLADVLRAAGIRVFGPSAAAAALEGSKVFAKELMRRHKVPTASFAATSDPHEARAIASRVAYPHVVKADGLAAGKGVRIVRDESEARAAIDEILVQRRFGAAGARVVFEEFLEGEEMSVFAVASGENYVLLPPAQDYKRAWDGDLGPNTGGMGSIAPVVAWTPALEERVRHQVIEPTLAAMQREGRSYRGLLYVGLMVRDGQPFVVEFNCRFGDPETQALVPILSGDLLDLMWAAAEPEGRALPHPTHDGRFAACVVMASRGYPDAVQKGLVISGIAEAAALPETIIFQAGTAARDEQLVTNGGRVLNVVGLGASLPAALERAYAAARAVRFEGAFYRRDIGWRGVKAASA